MTDERIRALERAVAAGGDSSGPRLSLARELGRLGRREEARVHVAAVLRAEPLSGDALSALDDLGLGPLAHDAPWPAPEGGNDRARRSAHGGARRGAPPRRMRIGREGEVATSLTVGPSTAYLATSYRRLIALDLASGKPRWIRDFSDDFTAPSIGEGERLLLGAEGHVRLLGPRAGETLWETRPPGRAGTEDVPVAFAPKGLVLAVRERTLAAFDATSGVLRWTFEAKSEIASAPAHDDAHVFVACMLSRLYAVSLDGKLVSEARTSRSGAWSLRVLPGGVYADPLKNLETGARGKLFPRDGGKLTPSPRILDAGSVRCALDAERVLMGPRRRIIKDGVAVADPQGEVVHAATDSVGCLYLATHDDVDWLDPTGALVKRLATGTGDTAAALAIGADSTLLVSSPRGILLVFE